MGIAHDPANSTADSAARTVLVADDNADAAESLALLLRTAGYTVHVAFGGPAAIELAAQVRPEVAVLDIGMPGMNGFQVARWVRQQSWGEGTRLVALTAWGTDKVRGEAKEAGFDIHLVKPAEFGEILSALAK